MLRKLQGFSFFFPPYDPGDVRVYLPALRNDIDYSGIHLASHYNNLLFTVSIEKERNSAKAASSFFIKCDAAKRRKSVGTNTGGNRERQDT